ncbi:MAG: hypothetical protein QX189_10715 [Methylococcales bacterium]
MKRFDVTLLFCKGGVYSCRIFAVSRVAAKAQAMRWARDCGFVGAIKKAEVIEIATEIAGDGNVPVSNVGG